MEARDFSRVRLHEPIDMNAVGRDGWYRLSGEPDPRNEFQKRRDALEVEKSDTHVEQASEIIEEIGRQDDLRTAKKNIKAW